MEWLIEQFQQIFNYILEEDEQALLGMFQNEKVDINVPRYGAIGNRIVFMRYIGKVKEWLEDHEARTEYWGAVRGDNRFAVNMVVYFDIDDEEMAYHRELHIPISIICEMEEGKLAQARVYYTTMWIAGHNITRPALLDEDKSLYPKLPETEKRYLKALWSSDAETIQNELFEPDGYFMGTAISYNVGPDLEKTFKGLFQDGKNTEIRVCSMIEDAYNVCIEYTNHRSGGFPHTPSSGVAIYGKSPNGKIAYARLAGDSLHDYSLWPTL